MFTLFSGLWRYMFQKDEYCILILGLDNAGKTTLLETIKRQFAVDYKGIPFEKIHPTVGMNVGRIDVDGIRLIFWDLGGQQDLQSLWDKYYTDSHGVMYVLDSSDKTRMDESLSVLENTFLDDNLDGVPLLMLANKQDKESSTNVDEIKERFMSSSIKFDQRDCLVQGISALNGDHIEAGIRWIVKCVKRNLDRPPREKIIT
eukprot:Seg1018.13 transcript_id=Seg1018.13/GoldUCD/mRNA.D3Y31 product="ADP-ribosylation factor-related protein 1" protein_id=Seg1018.13/GoldUCD/D3Y31